MVIPLQDQASKHLYFGKSFKFDDGNVLAKLKIRW